MSLQLLIALLQFLPSKSGHVPMFQPMSASVGWLPSASAVAQLLSLPAQAFVIDVLSLVRALSMLAWVFTGSQVLPLRVVSRHFWRILASDCRKPLLALMMAEEHLAVAFASASAVPVQVPSPSSATKAPRAN